MENAELRPFFGYYGGKWRDTPKLYPAPAHDHIIEPFAGSAGYSLRYASRRVTLCERDPILAGIWRYLVGVSEKEVRSLPDVPLDGSIDDLNGVCQEARWLIGFWLNRGVALPRKRPSKWMRDRIRPGSFWGERVRETIARQVSQIRHWKIVEGDYRDVRVRGAATWFVDPPYQIAGRHYRFGPSTICYDELREWVLARRGQVIVCENVGADWLPFISADDTKTTRAGRRSIEAVWIRSEGVDKI